MGEPTEAQIEAGAKAMYENYFPGWKRRTWDEAGEREQKNFRHDARSALVAAFGVSEEDTNAE